MGKQNKKEAIIKINTRQIGGKRDVHACGEELQSFFACMAVSPTVALSSFANNDTE